MTPVLAVDVLWTGGLCWWVSLGGLSEINPVGGGTQASEKLKSLVCEGICVPRRMLVLSWLPGKLQLQWLTLPFLVSRETLIILPRWREARGLKEALVPPAFCKIDWLFLIHLFDLC